MDLQARVERLEQENRRLKCIGLLLLIAPLAAILGAQAKIPQTVEAKEFVIRDGEGKIRAKLGPDELEFTDPKTDKKVSLTIIGCTLTLSEKDRKVELGVSRGCELELSDKNRRVELSVAKGCTLELSEVKGRQVRLGVAPGCVLLLADRDLKRRIELNVAAGPTLGMYNSEGTQLFKAP